MNYGGNRAVGQHFLMFYSKRYIRSYYLLSKKNGFTIHIYTTKKITVIKLSKTVLCGLIRLSFIAGSNSISHTSPFFIFG